MQNPKVKIGGTDGITIKSLGINDLPALQAFMNKNCDEMRTYHPEMMREVQRMQTEHIFMKDNLRDLIKTKIFYFGITTSYDHLIGCMCVYKIDWRLPKSELFYFVENGYGGIGILTRTFNWFIEYCFYNLNMEKLILEIAPGNHFIQKVALQNGFRKESLKTEPGSETGTVPGINSYDLWKNTEQ